MSGVAYGDHGLVNPDGIPGAELDLTAVSSGAGTIKSAGESMKTVADDLPSKWQKLSGVYESPESDQVFSLMNPVTDDVHTIGTVARKVASALETYASSAADPKRKLDELRVEAAAFVAEVKGGITRPKQAPIPKSAAGWDAYDPGKYEGQTEHVAWYDDPGTTLQNNNLIRKINEQVALLQAAQADCALAIKKAAGASVKKAFTAPTESDLNERGVDLPWSRVGTAKGKTWDEQFEEGFKDDFLKTVIGLTHLGGWDNSGDWSWGNLGSAWKGVGDGAVAFSLMVNPMSWLDAAMDPKGQSAKTLGQAGEAASEWWSAAQDNPGLATGAAASAVGTSFLGPESWAGRAGRAEELASGLGKLGAKDLAGAVESWSARGVAREHLDALAERFDDSFTEWARHHEVGGNPFDDAAFKQIWDEKVEAYQLAHPEFERHGIESKSFLENGGLQAVEGAEGEKRVPHTIKWHVKDMPLEQVDRELRDRGEDKKSRVSAYTLPVTEVDKIVARTLDHNHEEIQRWVERSRNAGGKPQLEDFDWDARRTIGRAYDPALGEYFNDEIAHVVLRSTKTPPHYEVYTSYTLAKPR